MHNQQNLEFFVTRAYRLLLTIEACLSIYDHLVK